MASQIITLVAVLLGAASTYVASQITERAKYRRDLDQRWTQRKLDAYVAYLSDIKRMRAIARRMLRAGALDDPTLPAALPREEGLPLLAEAEARRSVSAEVVLLVASEEVIEALRTLNQAIWKIEWFARELIDVENTEAWHQATLEYNRAINTFQERVRKDLDVPGRYVPRARLLPQESIPRLTTDD